jgi:hypothetical protein
VKRFAAALTLTLGVAAMTATAIPSRQMSQPSAPDLSLQQLLDRAGHDLPFDPQLAAYACPKERGVVKEGADADRNRVGSTLAASVAQMRARPKPSSYPSTRRTTTTEFHVWSVTAYLTQYRQEGDGDIHLVIKDSAGRSMIAELPYASCVPSSSRWRSQILAARSTFTRTYNATTGWHYVHRLVDLHGIGFMDPPHGQTGVAPNGVELHPVIYVHFH